MICGAVAVAGGKAPGLLHVLGVHAHDRADRVVRPGDPGVAQLARPTVLTNPPGRRSGGPLGRTDLGIALEPDDVAHVQLGEEAEQLGVGETAVGQDGTLDAGGQHLDQPAHGGVLIGVARVGQLVLVNTEPDQRRRPAVTSLSARCPSAS